MFVFNLQNFLFSLYHYPCNTKDINQYMLQLADNCKLYVA